MGDHTASRAWDETLLPGWETDIFLGDLARALVALKPRNELTRRAIAQALGLVQSEADIYTPVIASLVVTPEVPGEAGASSQLEQSSEEVPSELAPATSWVPSTLTKISAGPGEKSVVSAIEPTAGDYSAESPALIPLFVQEWTRAILTGALATNGGDGPVDLDRLVALVANRARLEQLPRLAIPTLRRGVQILVDTSRAMLPFARDQSRLCVEILNVVGEDRVQRLEFVSCPTRRVWDVSDGGRELSYPLPPAGTVVLVLTDLGIGRPLYSSEAASPAEWEAFAITVRRAGCPVVVLVPYAPLRWPHGLARVMTIIEWDRGTTAGSVRRQVGRGHEVSR